MSTQGAGSVPASLAASRLSEPAWVREGSPELQREYALGVEFERMLVQQLTSSLTASGEPLGEEGGGGEGSSGDAASSVLSSMVPNALADGVVAGGGLGLAAELTRQLQGQAGSSPSVSDRAAPATGAAGSAPGGAGSQAVPSGGVEADLSGGSGA
jgi:hypothetical protein